MKDLQPASSETHGMISEGFDGNGIEGADIGIDAFPPILDGESTGI